MKHKAKSFIAVLLALCLMMSLGVGALAVDGNENENPGGGNTPGGDDSRGGDSRGGDSPEPEPGEEHTLIIHNKLQNGAVTVDGMALDNKNQVKVKSGTEVTLAVTPNAGFKLEKLTLMYGQDPIITEDITATCKFTMPNGDAAVTATFVEDTAGGGTAPGGTTGPDGGDTDPGKYTISVQQPDKGGTVNLYNQITTVAEGTDVSFTAKPSEGYKLVQATVTPADESKSIILRE